MGTDAGRGDDAGTRLGVEAIEGDPDAQTLRVTGELDLVTAPLLRTELDARRNGAARVVLDLAGVEYLDSTGLVLLLEATREAQGEGWTLALSRDLGPAVARLLEITKTESLFTWADAP
jgi:anti-sigma B factor antagonist